MSQPRNRAGPRSTESPMMAGDITGDLIPSAGARRPLVLVVEDDPDVVDLVTDVLSDNGYRRRRRETANRSMSWRGATGRPSSCSTS